MTAPDEHDEHGDRLETVVERALRDLPQRRAPAALEMRIDREIQRRAALPWWHRSFAHWSVPTRSAFIAACLGVMTLTTTGIVGSGDSRYAHTLAAWALDRTQAAASIAASANAVAALLARLVPGEWLRIGLGLGVFFYVVLFGLGAAAYRTLYLEPHPGR
jgi:hypothetical protein